MKAEIAEDGRLVVSAEFGLEAFALSKWWEEGKEHGVLQIIAKSPKTVALEIGKEKK